MINKRVIEYKAKIKLMIFSHRIEDLVREYQNKKEFNEIGKGNEIEREQDIIKIKKGQNKPIQLFLSFLSIFIVLFLIFFLMFSGITLKPPTGQTLFEINQSLKGEFFVVYNLEEDDFLMDKVKIKNVGLEPLKDYVITINGQKIDVVEIKTIQPSEYETIYFKDIYPAGNSVMEIITAYFKISIKLEVPEQWHVQLEQV